MRKPLVGILMGDPSGVGPEILAKTAASGKLTKGCRPVLIGDARIFANALKQFGQRAEYQVIDDINLELPEERIYILDLKDIDPDTVKMGEVSAECGATCNRQIRKGVELFKEGKIFGIGFAPFNKTAMLMAGATVPSESEQFAQLFDMTEGYSEINMVDGVWTTRVTSHIPMKTVSEHLTIDNILGSIELIQNTLVQAGIPRPRIGVAAYNPHAGEHGLCGDEEIVKIAPAIERAKERGYDVCGPFPADTLFVRTFKGELDAVVTMYHDQGQIALKLHGFERCITIESGYPVPVCTCAHGTAHDIAGKGIVRTQAFEIALETLCVMAGNLAGKVAK